VIESLFDVLGMRVYESPFAVTREPARNHKRTRHQTAAYHRRIQKKWLKRFGTIETPAVLMIDPSAAGLYEMGGQRYVAHPKLMAAMRIMGSMR
jgi:hypothetical protein